jgi:polyisoprenyl-phosphate glycosyltransferase
MPFTVHFVAATGTRRDVDFEFIYVNDGSRDESLGHLLELRRRDTAPLCAA